MLTQSRFLPQMAAGAFACYSLPGQRFRNAMLHSKAYPHHLLFHRQSFCPIQYMVLAVETPEANDVASPARYHRQSDLLKRFPRERQGRKQVVISRTTLAKLDVNSVLVTDRPYWASSIRTIRWSHSRHKKTRISSLADLILRLLM
jgi:hypothetical protein